MWPSRPSQVGGGLPPKCAPRILHALHTGSPPSLLQRMRKPPTTAPVCGSQGRPRYLLMTSTLRRYGSGQLSLGTQGPQTPARHSDVPPWGPPGSQSCRHHAEGAMLPVHPADPNPLAPTGAPPALAHIPEGAAVGWEERAGGAPVLRVVAAAQVRPPRGPPASLSPTPGAVPVRVVPSCGDVSLGNLPGGAAHRRRPGAGQRRGSLR